MGTERDGTLLQARLSFDDCAAEGRMLVSGNFADGVCAEGAQPHE
jgi:hypothetical protein